MLAGPPTCSQATAHAEALATECSSALSHVQDVNDGGREGDRRRWPWTILPSGSLAVGYLGHREMRQVHRKPVRRSRLAAKQRREGVAPQQPTR